MFACLLTAELHYFLELVSQLVILVSHVLEFLSSVQSGLVGWDLVHLPLPCFLVWAISSLYFKLSHSSFDMVYILSKWLRLTTSLQVSILILFNDCIDLAELVVKLAEDILHKLITIFTIIVLIASIGGVKWRFTRLNLWLFNWIVLARNTKE